MDYQDYLTKYSIKHGISKEEAERHIIVQDVKTDYEKSTNYMPYTVDKLNAGCGGCKPE